MKKVTKNKLKWSKNQNLNFIVNKVQENYVVPYLETNPSKQVEHTKALETTIIKELGKMTP